MQQKHGQCTVGSDGEDASKTGPEHLVAAASNVVAVDAKNRVTNIVFDARNIVRQRTFILRCVRSFAALTVAEACNC